jgi:hypothetical protein
VVRLRRTAVHRISPACRVLDADAQDPYYGHYGHFTNEYGEQAVYIYDHSTGEATVRMGDAGWQNAYRLVNDCVEGVEISEAEAAWLTACWMASGGLRRQPRPPQDDEQADGVVH